MLALYLALYFQLPRPYWAMASVYVVSNPFVGATRSKALYRALGTLLGAAAAVFFVPPLVATPLILSMVVALWTGSLLFLALSDRTARSYVFLLAGYTLPLIAFPTVDDPTTIFDVASARSQEIILGIVCASVVNSNLFPNKLGPTLGGRTAAWFNDATTYVKETLKGRIFGKDLSAARQRLAGSVNGLEFLLSQLAYDDARPDFLTRAHALRGRMSLLLPIASALGDPLLFLRTHRAVTPTLETLLADVADWLDCKDGAERVRRADELRLRLDALEPTSLIVPESSEGNEGGVRLADASASTTANAAATANASDEQAAEEAAERIANDVLSDPHWDDALLSSLLWRLRMLIDLWQDCRALRELMETDKEIDQRDTRVWRPQLRHWRLGGVERHVDWLMMVLSVIPAVGATFCAALLWILTGWADGAAAVTLAAVSCSFFASLDQPAPQVFNFFIWTTVSVLLAGVYLFVVLPNVHDFPMLVVMFAVPFICVGTLIPQPRFTLATMLVSVNTATFMSIQSAYEANFMTFINSNTAGCAGLLFAFLWTLVIRPFGAEVAAGRLIRSGWADVVVAASPHAIAAQNNMASRMLDRLMQLLPRLGASDDRRHPSIDSFRDLRIGLNALDLQQLRRTLSEDLRTPIDRVLAGIRGHFEQCIAHRERLPAPAELADDIDHALAVDSGTRGAQHALVGLRLSLFPVPAQILEEVAATDAAAAERKP